MCETSGQLEFGESDVVGMRDDKVDVVAAGAEDACREKCHDI